MNKMAISAGTLYQEKQLQTDVCNHFTLHGKSKIIYDDTWLHLIHHQFPLIVTISDVYWRLRKPEITHPQESTSIDFSMHLQQMQHPQFTPQTSAIM